MLMHSAWKQCCGLPMLWLYVDVEVLRKVASIRWRLTKRLAGLRWSLGVSGNWDSKLHCTTPSCRNSSSYCLGFGISNNSRRGSHTRRRVDDEVPGNRPWQPMTLQGTLPTFGSKTRSGQSCLQTNLTQSWEAKCHQPEALHWGHAVLCGDAEKMFCLCLSFNLHFLAVTVLIVVKLL